MANLWICHSILVSRSESKLLRGSITNGKILDSSRLPCRFSKVWIIHFILKKRLSGRAILPTIIQRVVQCPGLILKPRWLTRSPMDIHYFFMAQRSQWNYCYEYVKKNFENRYTIRFQIYSLTSTGVKY